MGGPIPPSDGAAGLPGSHPGPPGPVPRSTASWPRLTIWLGWRAGIPPWGYRPYVAFRMAWTVGQEPSASSPVRVREDALGDLLPTASPPRSSSGAPRCVQIHEVGRSGRISKPTWARNNARVARKRGHRLVGL